MMARNHELEFWLKSRGYEFKYVEHYAVSKIDMDEARDNPARLGKAIDDTHALTIAFALDEGAPLTPILVFDMGAPLDLLGGGMHRLKGNATCKKPRTHLPAYVIIEPDPLRRETLIRTHNILNGREEDEDERLVHIAEMKRLHPALALKTLAAQFGMKPDPVQEYMRSLAAEKRAEEAGVGPLIRGKVFTRRLKSSLNTIQSPDVLAAMVSLIAAHPHDFKGNSGEGLIREVKEIGQERRAIKFIEERDAEIVEADERKGTKRIRSPSGRATKFIGRVNSMADLGKSMDKLYLESLGTTCAEFRRVLKVIDRGQEVLDTARAKVLSLIEHHERLEAMRKDRGKPGPEPISPSA